MLSQIFYEKKNRKKTNENFTREMEGLFNLWNVSDIYVPNSWNLWPCQEPKTNLRKRKTEEEDLHYYHYEDQLLSFLSMIRRKRTKILCRL